MRERVWGSPDVGRAPGCVRTQGTLPGSIRKRGMWRGVATKVRTYRTPGTQEMCRLRHDATPTDQTQGPFLLMVAQLSFSRKDTVNSAQALVLSPSIVLFENVVLYLSARRNIWSWSA